MFGLQAENEKLDWHQEWNDWLAAGDEINASTWSIKPSAGTNLFDETVQGSLTGVTVEGLEDGMTYQLINTVTTTLGLTGEREITIRCAAQV